MGGTRSDGAAKTKSLKVVVGVVNDFPYLFTHIVGLFFFKEKIQTLSENNILKINR